MKDWNLDYLLMGSNVCLGKEKIILDVGWPAPKTKSMIGM